MGGCCCSCSVKSQENNTDVTTSRQSTDDSAKGQCENRNDLDELIIQSHTRSYVINSRQSLGTIRQCENNSSNTNYVINSKESEVNSTKGNCENVNKIYVSSPTYRNDVTEVKKLSQNPRNLVINAKQTDVNGTIRHCENGRNKVIQTSTRNQVNNSRLPEVHNTIRQDENRNNVNKVSHTKQFEDNYRIRTSNESKNKNQEIKKPKEFIKKVSYQSSILNIEEFYHLPIKTVYINIPLVKNSPEFRKVHAKFRNTTKPFMKISKIEKIINPYLKTLFQLKMMKIRQVQYVCERLLFHGTFLRYLHNICENNFNWRLCGASVGTKFGQGISFSPIAYYASHYCDKDSEEKIMILSRVLVSKDHIGTKLTRIPKDGFDTTRNIKGDVIVKYDDDTFFPEYVIYFYNELY